MLSVVVAIVSDTTSAAGTRHLADCLAALEEQVDAPDVEVLVPYAAPLPDIDDVAARFPNVTFLPISDLRHRPGSGSREHHDELRARGLAAARGEIVAMLEDHGRPARDWCARVLEAHSGPAAGIGGAIENGVDRALNWGVYFCDFGRYQNPVHDGETTRASDANVSYKRAALDEIGPVWAQRFQEPAVNEALRQRGRRLALSSRIIAYQMRDGLTLQDALKERFVWGRSYAASRTGMLGVGGRVLYTALSPLLPAVLLARMTRQVFAKGRCRTAFVRALPFTLALLTAWGAGELAGYATAKA
jgi:hypothetical protein